MIPYTKLNKEINYSKSILSELMKDLQRSAPSLSVMSMLLGIGNCGKKGRGMTELLFSGILSGKSAMYCRYLR